jgi:hypothetical protein
MLTRCLTTQGDQGLNRCADMPVLLSWEQSTQRFRQPHRTAI